MLLWPLFSVQKSEGALEREKSNIKTFIEGENETLMTCRVAIYSTHFQGAEWNSFYVHSKLLKKFEGVAFQECWLFINYSPLCLSLACILWIEYWHKVCTSVKQLVTPLPVFFFLHNSEEKKRGKNILIFVILFYKLFSFYFVAIDFPLWLHNTFKRGKDYRTTTKFALG